MELYFKQQASPGEPLILDQHRRVFIIAKSPTNSVSEVVKAYKCQKDTNFLLIGDPMVAMSAKKEPQF